MVTTASFWIRYLVTMAVIVIGMSEILLRLIFSDPDTYFHKRFLFVSPRIFQNHPGGFWTYRPNVRVRDTGIFAMTRLLPWPGLDYRIEYDCRMRSNNLGLLQKQDVKPGGAVTLLLGDSFTAGIGGCPWFGRLQAKRKNELILNGGLPGTGFDQWRRLAEFIKDKGITIERVLIIAISNDFKRRAWTWRSDQLSCLDAGICRIPDQSGTWHPIGWAQDDKEVLELARKRGRNRFATLGLVDHIRNWLHQNSYVYKISKHAFGALQNLLPLKRANRTTGPGFLSVTTEALEFFKELGVPFHILMVPQKGEIALGLRRSIDVSAAIKVLKSQGVSHSWCLLKSDDYLPLDQHPNRRGYDKMVSCVDRVLDRLTDR